jgi:hypothetical protein
MAGLHPALSVFQPHPGCGLSYPVDHFGVYIDGLFREIVAKQAAFLARELAPEPH